ncbi:MAG: DNA gyrase inhibitor YacG [Alphaproteobacteria bacterium]|nr:DNA gyrase inhibitor YacG [Alphaproteobacteria bacterium]
MEDDRRPCPRCRAPAAPRPENRDHPFCSRRCRLMDLGAWLDEDYRIPGPPDPTGQA